MLYEIRLKTTEPWLGDKRAPQANTRRWARNADNSLHVDQFQWGWAYREALEALEMNDVSVDCIGTPPGIESKKMQAYRREFPVKSGKKVTEMFECIASGASVTFRIPVTKPLLGSKSSDGPFAALNQVDSRAPTVEELKEIFLYIGKYLGLSPWGAKWGYGRFTVLSIKAVNAREKSTATKIKKRIHINKSVIRDNLKRGAFEPPITCKTYKSNTYGHEAHVLDHEGNVVLKVVYRPNNPLSCGARVWIETELDVKTITLDNEDNIDSGRERVDDLSFDPVDREASDVHGEEI